MATHGTTVNEVPTGVKPAVRTTAGLPIYTGVGSINQGDLEAVNKPVVCYSLAEFVETFGEIPSGKWSEWTLHEAAKAHFSAKTTGSSTIRPRSQVELEFLRYCLRAIPDRRTKNHIRSQARPLSPRATAVNGISHCSHTTRQ
jgi:hypothetical protein